VIWVFGKSEYFFKWDWTGQIRLKCFDKFDFRRKALGKDFAALFVVVIAREPRVTRMRARRANRPTYPA
jgi:hypothetical protein